MIHTIEHRGKTITIEIDQDVTKFSYNLAGITYQFDLFDIKTSKQLKTLTFDFNRVIKDGLGNILNITRDTTSFNSTTYDTFYNMIAEISQGQFRDRGSVNMVISYVLGEESFAFNTYDQFAPIQPVIYDLTILGSDVTVTTINTPLSGSIEYSTDGLTYQASPVFTGLSAGSHKMYVRNTDQLLPFKKDFNI